MKRETWTISDPLLLILVGMLVLALAVITARSITHSAAQGTGCTRVTQQGLANSSAPAKFLANCSIGTALDASGNNGVNPPTGLGSNQGLSRIDVLNSGYGVNLFSNNTSNAFEYLQLGFVGAVPNLVAGPSTGGTTPLSFSGNFATWADNQACSTGQFAFDANFIYVCTGLGGTSNVKRAALSTF